MKRFLSTLGILALIALGFGLGAFYMRLNRPPLVLGQDAVVPQVDRGSISVERIDEAGGYIDIAPLAPADTLFVFYPGGLVRPQAYEWLGVALTQLGVRTVIPIMPLDLAVAAPNRATQILDSIGERPARVIIGGHSLGGAMAARYALTNADRLDGLVLMGAFSATSDDLSSFGGEVLVLAAENDGLATLQEVRDGLARLPATSTLEIIPGAVHAFFGRYGPQAGDGLPSVTHAEAEAAIINALVPLFEAR